MKKTILALILALVLAAQAQADTTIRFGILPVLDTLPLQVADKDGLFKEQGLNVDLIRFNSALERDTAMQAGQLDGYFGDIIATYLLIDHNVPMFIALTSWRTKPGFPMFGIAQSPENHGRTLEEMKGARLGYSRSTIMEYLADRMGEKAGYSEDYFNRVEIKKMPIRLQMLMTNQIETALLPEPLLTLAESQGGSVLMTAEGLDMPLTVLSLHRKYFDEGVDTYIRFITAYKEAVRRLAENPEAYRQLMAETCRIPKPLVDRFPIYPYPAPALPSEKELNDVQAWMLKKGLLKESVPLELVLSPIIP